MSTLPDLLSVFRALPGAYLLLSPDLVIEAVSDEYLAVTLTTRASLMGRSLFEAFPDNPAAPDAHATHNLRASLEQVLATGQPHEMARQRYDVPDPTRAGRFVERYWLPRNAPIWDEQGRTTHLLHTVIEVTEQAQNEAQLRASQNRERAALAAAQAQQQLQAVFAQAPVAICVFRGVDYVLDVVNNDMVHILGQPLEKLVGRPFFETLPELATQGLRELLDEVWQTGETFVAQAMEIHLARHAPGETGFYNFIYQLLRNEQGLAAAIICVATEVTTQVWARREVELLNQELAAMNEELQASNEELRINNDDLVRTRQAVLDAAQRRVQERETFYQVFAQTPACIALLRGPEHQFEYINAAYQNLFPNRQLVGRPLAEALPETVGQGFLALLNNVYRTGKTFFGNELLLSVEQPEGQPPKDVYFTFTYQAYQENGRTVGISIFAYDVTEQVLARQRREVERRQLQRLFMEAPAAICILAGPELVFELVNPGYQALFPGRELQGRPILEALPEIADHAVYQTFRGVLDTGQTHEEAGILIPLACPDGSMENRYFNYIQQARCDEQGRTDGVLDFAFEVTDQVAVRHQVQRLNEELQSTNEELRTTNEQLVRTNVDLDNFIYTASHDLKAPIANIEGLLLALQQELPATCGVGEVPKMLTLMQEAIERFGRTIGHLTDIASLQKEYGQATTEISLARLVREVQLDLAPLVAQAGAQLEVAVPEAITLTFSEKNLRSVVYNLLSNALKYRQPDRQLRVRVAYQAQAEYQVLEVCDNGLGFDLSSGEEKLFGMFQRLHTHVEGSGIGLYMVKRMVENVGGRIAVQSQPGEGSTFTVFFPR